MVMVFSPQVWSFCSEGETLVSGMLGIRFFFLVEVVSQSMCYRLMGQHRQVLEYQQPLSPGDEETHQSEGRRSLH